MISLIFSIIFFILFIFFCIMGGNYLLKVMIDNILNKNNIEKFNNINDGIINPIDECIKLDIECQNKLNFQTATNIPLSPNNYKNYIGDVHIHTDNKTVNNNNDNKNGLYCLNKNKLLYDGIWESKININTPYEHETWKLTKGDVPYDYYCSDKLIEVNKPFPTNFIDKSAVSINNDSDYYMYFNDTQNDVFDKEIQCFDQIA